MARYRYRIYPDPAQREALARVFGCARVVFNDAIRLRDEALKKAQRALSRKQKGSANRSKARRRVAVLHRRVRDARLDHAHKTALGLVRDNQAIYAEDIAVSGLPEHGSQSPCTTLAGLGFSG